MASDRASLTVSSQQPAASPRRWQLVVLLGALSMFGSLSTDMYLPALPSMARSLSASASAVQLTITASMVGLGVGQLFAGPLSDAFGRRRPVLVGVALYTISSGACALCGDVWTLSAMRLVQGMAGAAGIVVARAVVRDLYQGAAAARLFSRLLAVVGLGPILAPLVGAQILHVADWRGIFIALAGIGALLLLASLRSLPETLAPAARHPGGLGATVGTFGRLVRHRRFGGLTVVYGLSFGIYIAYIGGSPFVLEDIFGLSPQLYSVVFALNAVGLIGASQLSARLVSRTSPSRLARVALCVITTAAAWFLVVTFAHGGLEAVLPCFFLLLIGYGIGSPNLTALGMEQFPGNAGSASAVMGVAQFGAGAAVAPLVGLAGTHSATSTAIVIGAAAVLASLIWLGTMGAVSKRSLAAP